MNSRVSSSARRGRKAAERRGRRGEWLAALALRLKGYRILAKRYRAHSGEVDIIARRGDLVAMVEVKARKSAEEALHAVTVPAQRRIESAGDQWLSRQPDAARLSIRYDIVAIVPRRWPRHFPDAW